VARLKICLTDEGVILAAATVLTVNTSYNSRTQEEKWITLKYIGEGNKQRNNRSAFDFEDIHLIEIRLMTAL
jgi:hypothetical protein